MDCDCHILRNSLKDLKFHIENKETMTWYGEMFQILCLKLNQIVVHIMYNAAKKNGPELCP